jgi:hypothetical protein
MTTDEEPKTKNETQIAAIDSRSTVVRAALIAGVITALAFGWYSVRWQIANMLASLTVATESNAEQVADFSVALSPNDPITNWFAASVATRNFTPENIEKSLRRYEQAVRLAPNDFRWWIELGRAYEQADKMENAEKALLEAVRLAPNYTFPHWQLGNFYLRQGRDTEAFAELKKAADNNVVYREQVFSIAWDYYGKDTKTLEDLAGDSASIKASLAKFYAVKERSDDSLRIWNSLSPEDKQQYSDIAKLIAQAFYEKRFYRSAVQFVQQLGIEPNAKQETFENGGFETPVNNETSQVYFGWKYIPVEKIEVKSDPTQKHEGARSLRVFFNGFSGVELGNLFQIIAVESGARYRMSFWLKTENLKSAGTPTFEIINANDDKIIATGKAFPTETNDWQQIQIDFAAPANAEAVTIRTARAYCGTGCPIAGTIWLDDFRLEKLK